MSLTVVDLEFPNGFALLAPDDATKWQNVTSCFAAKPMTMEGLAFQDRIAQNTIPMSRMSDIFPSKMSDGDAPAWQPMIETIAFTVSLS
jgi:hypothetical protein